MNSLGQISGPTPQRSLAESIRRVVERITDTKELVSTLLEDPHALPLIDKFERLRQAPDFYDFARQAQQDLVVYSEIFLPLQTLYNSRGGSVPDVLLAAVPGITEDAQNNRGENHKQALINASENLSKTFPQFLSSVIEQAKDKVIRNFTDQLNGALLAFAAELAKLRDAIQPTPSTLQIAAIDLMEATVRSLMSTPITCRKRAESLPQLLNKFTETTQLLGQPAVSQIAVTSTGTTPQTAASPPIDSPSETTTSSSPPIQLNQALMPGTRALFDLFKACYDCDSGTVLPFDISRTAYKALMASLDPLIMKAIIAELSQIDIARDAALDSFRAVITERITEYSRNEITQTLSTLGLSDELRAPLLKLASNGQISSQYVRDLIENLDRNSDAIAIAISRIVEHGSISEEETKLLALGISSFRKLLQKWGYDEMTVQEIVPKLASAVPDWSDRNSWRDVRNKAGSSIKKYRELYRNLPEAANLAWDEIDTQYTLLGQALSQINHVVRNQLRTFGVHENLINTIILAHFPVNGPRIVDTNRRYQDLSSILNVPITHGAEGERRLIRGAEFPGGFWLTAAKMQEREWRDYVAALRQFWDQSGILPAVVCNGFTPSQLTSTASVRQLLASSGDSAGTPTETSFEAREAKNPLELRVSIALTSSHQNEISELEHDSVYNIVTVICFLARRRNFTALYDQLRARKFDKRTNELDEALKTLQHLGLVTSEEPNRYKLNVPDRSLLAIAISKRITIGKFLELIETKPKIPSALPS